MGEGFMGGGMYTPTLRTFLQVLSKLSQASLVKMFHFSDEWKVVSVAPQRGGGVHPPKSRGVFFRHIGHGN